jgi:hypothetical protein
MDVKYVILGKQERHKGMCPAGVSKYLYKLLIYNYSSSSSKD